MQQGQHIYQQCMGCHSFEYHRTGPMHCQLFGRQAGSAEGFDYSSAMRESDIVWNEESLDQFLKSPLTFLPGTSMGFVGLQDRAQRTTLIDYIKERSMSDLCAQ